ncbi:MAG TPA: 16S rRNA (uracil(1498)-N(3))-methyltransferase [Caulobacteraceae bacterium]|nr:16S rRNA (uracil(1498)-N(3))-methyltransferase [Caulobacteraceae bacterium]
MIRLFVPDDLAAGRPIALSVTQAHYLRDVMRRSSGDEVALFNGRHGEWLAALGLVERKAVTVVPRTRARAQAPTADLELVIALVKRARLETIVEKATELGVRRIRLAITRFTQAERTNVERLAAIAMEAAEQTGRLDVPEIVAPAKLDAILADWPPDRALIFCDEAGDATPILGALAAFLRPDALAASILIGPEGGFSPEERAHIRSLAPVIPVSLGPRILRADTAAIAALSLWQAALGDWRP